ncbi:MAG TPA: hypothetical protein H9732_07410 [Candidatus Mediterraneibacter avicola]|nr:hypothetical protein [Candidatus Mediterraneibacter avicola]
MIGKWGFSLLPFYLGIIPIFANNNYTLTNSFIGDLHCLGKDGYRFYTETKVVTTRWFDEEESRSTKVTTWDGTI